MKKFLMVCITLAFLNTAATADDWFAMDKCEVCKPMSKNMHLMGETKWQTYMLSNGCLSVSVIPPEHKGTMDECHAEMQAVIERAQQGEVVELCGHCKSWNNLMGSGAKKEELDTIGGLITILTSDDPEVVKKIQAHAKKSMVEFQKMMAETPTS